MGDMCCRIPVIALASLEVKFEVERSMAKIHILKPDPARKRLGCICWTRIRGSKDRRARA